MLNPINLQGIRSAMTLRAKMRCTRKTQSTSSSAYGQPLPVDTEDVEFQPVTGPGNEEWSKWTPGGSLKMQINNPKAVGAIEVGKDYFVDIHPAT